ncbi:MAG: hypothetical protein AAF329_28710, partial [Cyanobacteria bacterium P01_A01_bin.17]
MKWIVKHWLVALLLAAAMFCWASLGAMAQSPSPSPTPSPSATGASTAQVMLDNQPLFPLQHSMGSFSVQERADAVSQRLKRLAKDPEVDAEKSFQVKSAPDSAAIVAGEQIILTITTQDAQSAGRSPQDLASSHVSIIQQAIDQYRETHDSKHVLRRGIYVAIATTLFLMALILLRLLLPRFHAKLNSWKGSRIRAIRIQQLELLSEDRIVGLLVSITKFLRQPLVLGLIYFYALAVLGIFPGTKGIAM